MNLVIYQSNYGHTQRYGEWIAEALEAPLIPLSQVVPQDIEAANRIIFGTSIYAGTYQKLDRLSEWFKEYPDKEFIFFGVSVADPSDQATQEYLESCIEKSLNPENFQDLKIFLFQGGLDYSRLNFVHRSMMWMMIKMLKRKKDKSTEDQIMIDGYGKKMDYVNRDHIEPLVEHILQTAHH